MAKEMMTEIKRPPLIIRKVFAHHTSDQRQIFTIYEALTKLTNKKNNPTKKIKEELNRHFLSDPM